MTLTAVVAPLAAYAVLFQTAVYLSLPARLRSIWAPVVTGLVGAVLTVLAGAVFGFHTIGVTYVHPLVAISWGCGAVVLTSIVGMLLLSRPSLRRELADPRLAAMRAPRLFVRVLIRIPIFTALIEEAFFRGVLHAALMALYPVDVAVWLGAGLFGMWHIGPGVDQAQAGDKTGSSHLLHTAGTVVATTVAGLLLIWLRIETGSIWAPAAVHAAINMTMAMFSRAAARVPANTIAGVEEARAPV